MAEIMMIEDDVEITELLKTYLAQYGMNITGYTTPSSALNALQIDNYDLIILDLSLPEMDGLELFKIIAAKYPIPVIISTARGDLTDKVMGLELGADDYLPKPYNPRELVARIKTVLRRYQGAKASANNEFVVNEEKMEISKNGKVLEFTLAEYELFKLLINKKDMVISREYIANNVDAISWDSSDRSIDVIVGRIRQKIGDSGKNSNYIKSIRGVGYKFIGE